MEEYAGTVAMLVTLAFMLIGLPMQIIKIHRKRSVEDLSPPMCILWFATFVSWVWYGCIKADLFIVAPNVLGILLVGVILGQVLYFRRKSNA